MSIHIGEAIHEIVKASPFKNKDITDALHLGPTSIYTTIFKRESIDTDRLLQLCSILKYDFFALFYEEEPLKSFKEQELADFQHMIRQLEATLADRNLAIAQLNRTVDAQQAHINTLQSELNRLRQGPLA